MTYKPIITHTILNTKSKQILTLPPIERKLVRIELAEGERLFYNALLDKSQSVFEGYVTSGTASKSWFAIFSLLNRLRQACDHLSLTVKGDTPISNANKCMKISSNGANNDQGDLNDKVIHSRFNHIFNVVSYDKMQLTLRAIFILKVFE
jgi:SNF2 family DNA or RNA helicase